MYFQYTNIKRNLILSALCCWQLNANAANLLDVYQQAIYSDPIFQQAIAQSLVTRDNVPISVSYLLPNISVFTNPTVSRYGFSGTEYRTGSIGSIQFRDPRNLTQRTYKLDLTLTQPVFDFSLLAAVYVQLDNAKSACATLNASLQNLMIRVAKAYFAVQRDEEEIIYTIASRNYYEFQLKLVTDQQQAGIKTMTDVYTARAAYEASAANYIVANKRLENDRENLRAITNVYYPRLASLKNNFPLISPQPNNIEEWVRTALMQNWSIKAAQYSASAARQNIKQQIAGHFPTISLQSSISRNYTYNINRYQSFIDSNGPGTIQDKSIGFNIDFPIFEGGGVVSKTNQAKHMYEQQSQILEENFRTTVNNTRQSFTNITAGIAQIKADKHIINASVESLQGTIDRYNAGIQTLLDVLNREETLYQAQVRYANDRYDYVNNLLLLKEAAGTLSFDDLRAINSWLTNEPNQIKPFQDKLLRDSKSTIHKNILEMKTAEKTLASTKNFVQNPMNNSLKNIIAIIKDEHKQAYEKLAKQNQQSKIEIAELKATLEKLKQALKK